MHFILNIYKSIHFLFIFFFFKFIQRNTIKLRKRKGKKMCCLCHDCVCIKYALNLHLNRFVWVSGWLVKRLGLELRFWSADTMFSWTINTLSRNWIIVRVSVCVSSHLVVEVYQFRALAKGYLVKIVQSITIYTKWLY